MIVLVALAAALLLGAPPPAYAHPMPDSTVVLDVRPGEVRADLRLPAEELMLASGPDVRGYLAAHLRPATAAGEPWRVTLDAVETEQSGAYREVVAHAVLTPPESAGTRRFVLGYDAVVHQVATHRALISVREDGGPGRQVAVLATDNRTMTVPPVTIDLGPAAGPGVSVAAGVAVPTLLAAVLVMIALRRAGRSRRAAGRLRRAVATRLPG
ncbi:hypothetical protein [Actinoplanes missouriensis]|uniref:hypothetical protein n=1 Tax=Actinoplanes missouriensis TaxID=1866 RepID=UPI0012F9F4DE|nr:hypothetical protein [Actinoplanes missouriensis]